MLGRVLAYGSHGMACVLAKDWETARESLELSLELGRASQTGQFLDAFSVAALAEARLGLGDEGPARASFEEAIQLALRVESPVGEIRAQLARGRILLALDDAEAYHDIEPALCRAEELVRTTGARAYEPQVLVERARVAGLLSESERQRKLLAEAQRMFGEMGATGHVERTKLLAKASR